MPTALQDVAFGPALVGLGAAPASKEAAIGAVARLLEDAGCIAPGYTRSMLHREAVTGTFLGQGVAIPHGMGEDRHLIRRDGIAALQVPGGVDWGAGQVARLIVAIAARGEAHLDILRRLAALMQDRDRLASLAATAEAREIVEALAGEEVRNLPQSDAAAADFAHRFEMVVTDPAGLHARPAAAWAEAARQSGLRVRVRHGDEVADGRNLVALLHLALRAGDRVVISAEGEDEAAGLARLRTRLASLAAPAAQAPTPRSARGWTPPGPLAVICGIAASPGLAIGRLHVMAGGAVEIADEALPLTEGAARLEAALAAARAALHELATTASTRLGASEAAIFRAQAELLHDDELIVATCRLMVEGHGPASAWQAAVGQRAASLAALDDPVLAGRAADLRDAGRRVLACLEPASAVDGLAALPEGECILVAPDLPPSEMVGLDPARVAGLATAAGGPAAHTAILARTLGLPALVGGGDALLGLPSGVMAILDGATGCLYPDPPAAALDAAIAWRASSRVRQAVAARAAAAPAVTQDGQRIGIAANVDRPGLVAAALAAGGEGVGLMRTEFLVLDADALPDEDAQLEVYCAMIAAVDGRRLVIRALDLGGDKQAPHLGLKREANPFLGVRGARLLLRRPDLLEPQLRAIYRAAMAGGDVAVMFPMVTSVDEIVRLRAACERVRVALCAPVLPVGIMIEVPAAAVMADRLAAQCDFLSIGTNDLTQYTLATDRQNPDLAAAADSLHPAVLRLVAQVVAGAAKPGCPVSVCGGMAGDPAGAALLAGLGVTALSMAPPDIAAVKARLCGARIDALRALAARALDAATADEVRALEAGA
ncbi:MAG: phosphoenolpyruvate--protein phosphotransferase [Acidiphilium sp. 37-67-22]|nr:MAG: phosphoenolpyruvate--protein phosphotransferase [Acidiphilium sp. 37-67-22]